MQIPGRSLWLPALSRPPAARVWSYRGIFCTRDWCNKAGTWRRLHLSHTNPLVPENNVHASPPHRAHALYMCRSQGPVVFPLRSVQFYSGMSPNVPWLCALARSWFTTTQDRRTFEDIAITLSSIYRWPFLELKLRFPLRKCEKMTVRAVDTKCSHFNSSNKRTAWFKT